MLKNKSKEIEMIKQLLIATIIIFTFSYPCHSENINTSEVKLYSEAIFLLNTGKYDESMQKFDSLLKSNPNNIKALTDKTKLLIEIGSIDEAIKICDQVYIIDQKYNKNKVNKAVILYSQNKFSESLLWLNDVIENNNQNNTAIILLKAISLINLNKTEEAKDCLNKIISLEPNNVLAKSYLNSLN